MAQANMYRVTVGDFVYFEQTPGAPFLIRKIDELTMTPNKNVEARCLCYYRRRDLPPNLLVMADRYQSFYDVDQDDGDENNASNGNTNGSVIGSPMKTSRPRTELSADQKLQPRQIYQLKHRELYISRTVETLPATGIRGKCTVTLLNEEENLQSYLNAEDAFFYSLKYDPQQKTLNTDRGDIKVGSKYQVDVIPPVNRAEALARSSEQYETLVWNPETCPLSDEQISNFIIIAKSVGLYARAVDTTSTIRNPSLLSAAITSSRDSILQFAANLLHRCNYDVSKAVMELTPSSNPVLVRDQLEEWSPSETALFEEGMDKYGKDFENIRQDLLPWKTMRSIIEFYYIWKSTDRAQNKRKLKAAESENKMKQVYIPAHTKPNPAMIVGNKTVGADGKSLFCESCGTNVTPAWFAWSQHQPAVNTPQNLSAQAALNSQHKLCQTCWNYWKKYGGLKQDSTRLDSAGGRPDPTHRAERAQQIQQNTAKKMVACQVSDCQKRFRDRQQMLRHLYNTHEVYVDESGQTFPLIKTPSAFVMTAPLATMLMRRLLARGTVQLARVQRNPTNAIDFAKVYKEYGVISDDMKKLEAKRLKLRKRKPHFLATGLRRLNVDLTQANPEWLQRTGETKQPARLAFPKPEKMPWPVDQQPLNDRKGQQPPIMRKRNMDAASISPVPSQTTQSSRPGSVAPKQEPSNLSVVKSEASAANLTTQDRAHQNGVGPTPPKQQHMSSPPTHGTGTSTRNSNIRPPVHYPGQNGGTKNGSAAPSAPTRPTANGNSAVLALTTNGLSHANGAEVGGSSGGPVKKVAGEDFAPDDMFFVASPHVISARKVLTAKALKKACRRPFLGIRVVGSGPGSTAGSVKAEPAAAMDTSSSHSHASNNGNGPASNGAASSVDMSSSGSKLNGTDGRTAMLVD